MTLGEVSQRMMVSNGNVTGSWTGSSAHGLARTPPAPNDRRAQIVALTPGRARIPRAWPRATRLDRELFGELD